MYWRQDGDEIVARNSNNIIIKCANGVALCISYATVVAWCKDGVFHRSWGGYSQTTQRHLSRFCNYLGIPNPRKREWEEMDVEGLPEKLS